MKTMRIIAIGLLFFFLKGNVLAQQTKYVKAKSLTTKLSEETTVYDSTGKQLPFSVWQLLAQSGDFGLRKNTDGSFVLYKRTDKEKAFRDSIVQNIVPQPSTAFHTGEPFYKIKTTDIYGDKLNTKQLKGKILVLNYWFINCAPCRQEIPELNKIAAAYKNDSSVVFWAIALDASEDIADFLKEQPFDYTLIGYGRQLNGSDFIKSYPTNVVVDREGKVYFHSSGYGPGTASWIKKSIEEIKAKQTSDIRSQISENKKQ